MNGGCVTVFGGTGFLGRRIAARLSADGWEVRIAARHPETASLPDTGKGRIVPLRADIRDPAAVAHAVADADAVVNAVGLYVERGDVTFEAVHERGACTVAEQSARAGVERLIHISGIGADANSGSRYVRARAEGERLVKGAFRGATILRPSLIFGPDDAFSRAILGLAQILPALPLFGGGRTKLQPVFVDDVAGAVAKALATPSTAGQTYELGGPRVYTYASLMKSVLQQHGRRRLLVPVPFLVGEAMALLMTPFPNPPLTRDQIALMKLDNVVGEHARSLSDLGIEAVALESILPARAKS